jgi:competence protein ComEC
VTPSELLARRPRHAQALALCAGLAAALVVRPPAGVILGVATLAALTAALAPSRARPGLVLAAVSLAGCWWGNVRLVTLDRSVLSRRIGDAAPAMVTVTGAARRGAYSIRVPAEVRRFDGEDLREAVLLRLPPGRAPPQGAVIELVVAVAAPRPPEDGFDEGAWLARQGRHVVLEGGRWRIVGKRGGVAAIGDRLRRRLARTMAPGLHGERQAVIAGIVLGEDEGLSDELRHDFRAAGLYHLLAVSGQNVAFIAGGLLGIAWIVGVPRLAAEVAVLLAIAAYVLAVGWQPSVVRASVAGSLVSLAWLTARPRDRWYFLLAGAVVLLAWNPYSLLEPGFQLSFAAVVAIFVGAPRLERLLEGYPIPRPLALVVAVSTACGLATAPIAFLHFGAVPTYTLPANVLAAPVVGPLLGLGLVAAALDPVLPGAALALAWLNGWLAAYLAWCARFVAGLPFAQVESGRALAVVAALAAAPYVLVRLRRRQRRLVLAVVALVVGAGGWRLVPREPAPVHGLRITFLDVGQGDSVLLQTAQAAVLVDEGPPEGKAAEQIARLGVRRLSLVVLTHPQRDHVGDAADVLRRTRVDAVLDPRLPAESSDEDAALGEARRHHVRVLTARAGDGYVLGRLRLRVLWPDGPGRPGDDPNDHAIVLLASFGSVDALLTADAEGNVTVPLRPPPVEILKVAHHGSADPDLPELLRLTRPRVAVISVGERNDYGHPTPSTLHDLGEAPSLDVYRTDRDGRVVVETDGRRLVVRRQA